MKPPAPRGRGSHLEPANRFTLRTVERYLDQFSPEELEALARRPTRYITERADSIVSENDSPDIPFRFSLNPYRGCEHGCIYCYARPTHEWLSLSAGLDFESQIFVKEDARVLLRKEVASTKWEPQHVSISGVTDAYQPVERRLELTRRCLK